MSSSSSRGRDSLWATVPKWVRVLLVVAAVMAAVDIGLLVFARVTGY